MDYHRDHSAQWVLRLALGTDESRARMIHGLKVIWPYVDELFRDDELTGRLSDAGVAVQPFQPARRLRPADRRGAGRGRTRGPAGPARPRRRTPRPPLRAPGLPPRRDAGPGPRVSRSELVTMPEMYVSHPTADAAPGGPEDCGAEGLGARRHGLRPGNPGPHHRGPRHPARCPGGEGTGRGRRRHGPRGAGHHHAHLLGLPRHGRHPRRPHRGLQPATATPGSTWTWCSPRPGPPTG